MEMEWIILSGSILVAAYFIYSAIQRNNDIRERQLGIKGQELESDPEYDKQALSSLKRNLEDDIIKAKVRLEDAQESGDKHAIKEAKDNLETLKADYTKSSIAWLGAFQAARKHKGEWSRRIGEFLKTLLVAIGLLMGVALLGQLLLPLFR